MSRRASAVTSTCAMLLRATSLFVPRRERLDWLAEWRGELHYVLGCGVTDRDCIAFSLGAVPDAFWIGRHSLCRSWLPQLGSPIECLTFLAVMAVASVSLALYLPQVRQEIFPPPYDGPPDLVALGRQQPDIVSPVPPGLDVSAAEYFGWSAHPHPGLTQLAFYEPVAAKAQIGARVETWHLGRTTTRLAGLLNFRIPEPMIAACRRSGATPIVLSRGAWMRVFAADPNVAGRVLRIEGRKAIIVGIAPEITSALPAQVDAWSLEPEKDLRSLAFQPFAYGYMLARLAPLSPGKTRGIAHVELTSDLGDRSRLYVVPLSSIAQYRRYTPEIDFLLTLLTICLMLPAILAVFLRSGLKTERISLIGRTKGWAFLGAKVALLLPLLFCEPLLIAAAAGLPSSGSALDLFITVGLYLFAAFWVVEDQRQRCPRCLRRLTSPTRVGERSWSFLAFSGIEYVCAEGHGLLHVPDFPTSWFASQRWLPLDPSWRGLFQHGS
ncbi:MAG: hypothetical protein ACRD3N_15195 [Terracidiphilus sp.]